MASRVRSDVQQFIHDNYSIDGTPATKEAGLHIDGSPVLINYLLIENMDSTNSIAVSFDGGTNWKTLKPGYSIDVEVDSFVNYMVKALAGTVPVEALYGVEA
jgi:hypothetical protein